jgi:hypothetical protein
VGDNTEIVVRESGWCGMDCINLAEYRIRGVHHEVHHQHSFPVRKWLQPTIFEMFVYTLVNVHSSTAMIAVWFQHSQMKPRFHHVSLIQYDLEVHCHFSGIIQKSLD